MIPLHSPSYDRKDLRAIGKVIRSNWTGLGPQSQELINEWASKYNRPRSCFDLTNSATEAIFQVFEFIASTQLLHTVVILPSVSYQGISNAVLRCGFIPQFVDINGKDHMMPDSRSYIDAINRNESIVAIVLMSYGGQQYDSDIQELLDLCVARRIYVIEDSAACVNSNLMGTYGDFGIWSFDSLKTLSGFDGGMIYCRDPAIMEMISSGLKLGYHQFASSYQKMNQESKKWWINHPVIPARRSITNDVSASLVRSQMKKLDKFCAIQKHFLDYFNFELYGTPAFSPLNLWKNDDCFLYLINAGSNQQEMADYLKKKGIYTGFKYYPVHQSDLYWKYNSDLPKSDLIASTHLNIPLHKNLTIEQAEYIVSSIKSYYTNS